MSANTPSPNAPAKSRSWLPCAVGIPIAILVLIVLAHVIFAPK
jgi:hypothetical protein